MSLTRAPAPYDKNLSPLPQKFSINRIWSVTTISLGCSADFHNTTVRWLQKNPTGRTSPLAKLMSPYFLHGACIPWRNSCGESELSLLSCSEPFTSLWSWFLVLNLSLYFPKFQCFSQKWFFLSSMQTPSHPDNLFFTWFACPEVLWPDAVVLAASQVRDLFCFHPIKSNPVKGRSFQTFCSGVSQSSDPSPFPPCSLDD